MALNKIITAYNGIECSYHRVDEYHVNEGVLTLVVGSYISQEHRLNAPVQQHKYVTGLIFTTPETVGATAYEYLKTLPEFQDAGDV